MPLLWREATFFVIVLNCREMQAVTIRWGDFYNWNPFISRSTNLSAVSCHSVLEGKFSSARCAGGLWTSFLDLSLARELSFPLCSIKLRAQTIDGKTVDSDVVRFQTILLLLTLQDIHRKYITLYILESRVLNTHILEKCDFHTTNVSFLGYIISSSGI